jgi:hypothetical protein
MEYRNRKEDREILRTASFTEAEIVQLKRLRQTYVEHAGHLTRAEERRLQFVRWLVTTGRLTERLPL